MKKIAEIVEFIHDETSGAEEYAKMATRYKMDDKALADSYAAMAAQELEHVDKLHAQVVRIIKEWKAASSQETPASISVIWDWEHGKIVDTVARIKAMLEIYKK